ncbi:hypothetical protein T310_7433, partial [Rasamsonia emersonii CBS 393.64]
SSLLGNGASGVTTPSLINKVMRSSRRLRSSSIPGCLLPRYRLLEAAFLALFSCESLDPVFRSISSRIKEDESLLCISRNTHKGRILRHTLFFDEFPLSRLSVEIMFWEENVS